MSHYQLSFGEIIILEENIAEVIINEGVQMDVEMVEQYHDFLLSHLKAPFSLLINKVHSYTYDFDAQLKLAELHEINKMAVISYDRITTQTTDYLAAIPRSIKWNLQIFSSRKPALAWLKS